MSNWVIRTYVNHESRTVNIEMLKSKYLRGYRMFRHVNISPSSQLRILRKIQGIKSNYFGKNYEHLDFIETIINE
jgi:hypothetical protein